jgi:hypothetical protein
MMVIPAVKCFGNKVVPYSDLQVRTVLRRTASKESTFKAEDRKR